MFLLNIHTLPLHIHTYSYTYTYLLGAYYVLSIVFQFSFSIQWEKFMSKLANKGLEKYQVMPSGELVPQSIQLVPLLPIFLESSLLLKML